jgi:hypothetical protein
VNRESAGWYNGTKRWSCVYTKQNSCVARIFNLLTSKLKLIKLKGELSVFLSPKAWMGLKASCILTLCRMLRPHVEISGICNSLCFCRASTYPPPPSVILPYIPFHYSSPEKKIVCYKRPTWKYPNPTQTPNQLLRYMIYRVRINYRSIFQSHLFTNTEQKYMMLLPLERGIPGGWRRPVRRADLTTFMCRLSWSVGASNS